MKQASLLTTMLILFMAAKAQVAINNSGANPSSSAMLDISSTSKGVLITRMTSAQRKAISNPETGLMVFDTDRQTIFMYDGGEWRGLSFTTEENIPPVQRHPSSLFSTSQFGFSVAIDGNYAVVGAPADTANGGVPSGAAYVFVKENGTWKEQARLAPGNLTSYDQFGNSVDIHNDIIVVGAPRKDISNVADRGRAYVFQREGEHWVPKVGLMASDGLANDHFGFSVSVYNQFIAVGAPGKDYSSYTDPGCAYIFRFENNSWVQKSIIYSWAASTDAGFGFDLELYNKSLIVGEPGLKSGYPHPGTAYTFNNTDINGVIWSNGVALGPSVSHPGMKYGYSVAMSATTCLVGAPEYSSTNLNTHYNGMWYIYKKGGPGWVEAEFGGSMEGGAREGFSVSLDGDDCYIGSPHWGTLKGRMIIYKDKTRHIYNVDEQARVLFGSAVAAQNGQFVIGAPGHEGATVNFGKK